MSRAKEGNLTQQIATTAIAGFLVYGLLILFKPFVIPIMIGAILSSLSRPLYTYLLSKIGSPTLSALLTVLIILIGILLPLGFIVSIVLSEVGTVGALLKDPNHNIDSISSTVNSIAANIGYNTPINLVDVGSKVLDFIDSKSSIVLGSVIGTVGSLLLSFITAFYMLQSQEQFRLAVLKYSPLEPEDSDLILTRVREVIKATVRGNLLLLGLQAIASMVCFAIFGVSAPVLLGLMYGIASLVPAVGSSLIWLPVAIFQLVQGNIGAAIGITIWAVCQVMLFDNYLGPRLIQRQAHLHPFLILLGVLGGVSLFGGIGIIVGPTAVALGLVGLEILHRAWQSHPE